MQGVSVDVAPLEAEQLRRPSSGPSGEGYQGSVDVLAVAAEQLTRYPGQGLDLLAGQGDDVLAAVLTWFPGVLERVGVDHVVALGVGKHRLEGGQAGGVLADEALSHHRGYVAHRLVAVLGDELGDPLGVPVIRGLRLAGEIDGPAARRTASRSRPWFCAVLWMPLSAQHGPLQPHDGSGVP
jgi:hypothetical protein